ncbi:hypothetical protein U1Q18_031592 [Sarracenia purpurea var. burkii]
MTIVGRVSDGLPLAQGRRYVNEDDTNFSSYKQKAEFILNEISRPGSPLLASSKMTIRVDHHCFHCMVENGICFITLCDSSYPRKLAFYYLQDLVEEFGKFDASLINKITKPYSFVKFGRGEEADLVCCDLESAKEENRFLKWEVALLSADAQRSAEAYRLLNDDKKKLIAELKGK